MPSERATARPTAPEQRRLTPTKEEGGTENAPSLTAAAAVETHDQTEYVKHNRVKYPR